MEPSLEGLWQSAPAGQRSFRPAELMHLPEPVRRYLEHAIAPGTPLASAVRLRMRGEIKLGRWFSFAAEQVISQRMEMVWNATVRLAGVSIFRGFDRLVDGEGAMRWKLLGMVPIISAAGADITRSAAGRLLAELVWLPSALCGSGVLWSGGSAHDVQARLRIGSEEGQLALAIGDHGCLQRLHMRRWGNPQGKEFKYHDFGGLVETEKRFGGYTIPSRLRIGWHFGTERFEREGEFFRVTVENAAYRYG